MKYTDKGTLTVEICHIIAQVLQKDVKSDTRLLDSGGYVDSMNIMEMVTELEQRYNISFDDELTLDYLDNVESLINCVFAKLNEG